MPLVELVAHCMSGALVVVAPVSVRVACPSGTRMPLAAVAWGCTHTCAGTSTFISCGLGRVDVGGTVSCLGVIANSAGLHLRGSRLAHVVCVWLRHVCVGVCAVEVPGLVIALARGCAMLGLGAGV